MRQFDPSEISNWASLPDANHQLPELIRRLILATVPELSRLDIPSGSSVWGPGWDGMLTVGAGNAWAPKGHSVWEFSCRRDVVIKANEDYRKRTDPPQGTADAATTFVFVTPRRWMGKDEWETQRRDEGEWADVRALDASNLAAWLSQAPATAEWFAQLIGKSPAGGYTALDEWWENWATACQPNISPALVVAGRQESVERLAGWAREAASPYYVQAQMREEAIAFVAASALDSDDAWGAALLSKALVVKSEDAWNSLVRHTSPLALIRAFDGNVSAPVATGRGHHVIAPLHANEDPRGNGDNLPRLGRDETVAALTEMGLSEPKARMLARKTASSLPIIRRFLIDEAGGPTPGWALLDSHSCLPALALIGQWDEDNGYDTAIVAQITGRPYEEVAHEIAALALTEDSPLTKIGGIWRFLSHEEAWHLLAPRLTAAEVGRFQEAATTILGVESPEFEMPVAERHLANIHGKVVPHSGALRDGIARALALMGNQGERARNVTTVSYLPERILRDVLTGNEGWELWATLDRQLATLAEAAPEAMLSAIEQRLATAPDTLGDLFAQEGAPLFGGSSHTGLLWALETLAWSPDYFARAASILARLALIDPGGRITNRPAESLSSMFLPWFRVSETSDADRLETLGMMLSRHPEPGWKTLVNAYPSSHGFVVDREPPSWRPWGQDGVPKPTWAEIRVFVEGMERLLIEHVENDADRWMDVLGIISRLSPDARRRATDSLTHSEPTLSGNTRAPPRYGRRLREELNRHRSFPDVEWAMAATDLEPLAAIYEALTPADPAAAYAWLFDGWPKLPEGTERRGTKDHFEQIQAVQQAAVSVVYDAGGAEDILSIAKSAKQPQELGWAFAVEMGTERALTLAVEHAGSDNRNVRMMASGILRAISHHSGWTALDDALARLKIAGNRPQALADVFLSAPATQDTWRRLVEEEPEVQRCYWELLDPWQVSRDGEIEVDYVAQCLLNVQRSPAAAEWIAHASVHHETVIRTLEQLPIDLATGAGPESGSNGFIYDIANLFKKLDDSDAVGDDTIACLELPFISALSHSGRANLAIFRVIAREPALFADLIAAGYKRDDGQTDAAANDQATQRSGEILSKIIFGEGEIPGKTKDGTVDYETLSAWVNEAPSPLFKPRARDDWRSVHRATSGESTCWWRRDLAL